MTQSTRAPSARRDELLERAYRYAIRRGLADLSLRPLAAAIDSSPRVLLFLFDSKEGLVRALLARARKDELALLERSRAEGVEVGVSGAVAVMWRWLSADEHRPLLALWLEAYALSLVQPAGPWAGFARQTVEDWLAVLAEAQSTTCRRSDAGVAERTLALAVLRGALLDLLATGDLARATAAVDRYVNG